MDAKEIIQKLLEFQYDYLGHEQHRCRSCGALNYFDFETGKWYKNEACSNSCP